MYIIILVISCILCTTKSIDIVSFKKVIYIQKKYNMFFTYSLGPKNSGEAAATERIVKIIATLSNYNKSTLKYDQKKLVYF